MTRPLPIDRKMMFPGGAELFNSVLRSGVPLLIVCVCVLLIGTEAFQLAQLHRANIEQTDVVSANLARAMAEQAETTLQTADTVVATLAKQVEEEGTSPEALTRFYRLMTSLAVALPAIHEMGIIDSQGNAIAKSLKPDPRGLNYSEREYFRYHATHDDRGPFIGARIKSKIDDTYSITVTRRINNSDGSFGGLAVTSVSLDFFQRLFNRVQAKSGGVILLVADDDTILARAPPPVPDMRDGQELRDIQNQASGDGSSISRSYVSASDGIQRRGSYVHLSRFPMSTLVAQSEWDVQRSWRAELTSYSIILGCVIMVLTLLGRHAMRVSSTLLTQAMHDGLTGLPNRRAFDETIEWEIRRVTRTFQPLSIILIDIDHFKQYNDAFGHPAGDECLRIVARTIRGCLRRSGEFAARYGGEEFVVLLPGSTKESALEFAETIRLALRRAAVTQAPSLGGIVTISSGVATRTPGQTGEGPQNLIQIADTALYAAKAAGRDTVQA